MKTVKTTTLRMALLGLAVLFVACNGNDKKPPYDMNEARNRVARAIAKEKNKKDDGKRNKMQRKNRLDAIDSVIVGNFTGKGMDTLYIAKHCCAKPFYTSYEQWDASCGEDEVLTDENYNVIKMVRRKGRIKETELESCTMLSRSGNLPKLEFKNVYGRGMVFEGDLDGNGTDEFGYFTLKHRYPIKLNDEYGCERDGGILYGYKQELLNYVYYIITFLDGKWQCMAIIDDEYVSVDGLVIQPSDSNNIKAIHTYYDRYNCGNLGEMYGDTFFIPIKYKPI